MLMEIGKKMSDAIIAKDLLLGKNPIIVRCPYEKTLVLYVRLIDKRKAKSFLKKLVKYITQDCQYKVKYHTLNIPECDNDFMIATIDFDWIKGFNMASDKWKAYKEVAFG